MLIADLYIGDSSAESPGWLVNDGAPYRAVDPIDVDQSLIDSLWSLYSTAYRKVSYTLLAKGSFHFLKYNRWILLQEAERGLRAFSLFKETPFGLKLSLTAADLADKTAKQALVDFLLSALQVKGVYAEVSDRLREIVEGRVPEVKVAVAARVLNPKTIASAEDGRSYHRDLRNVGVVTKLMVGRPLI